MNYIAFLFDDILVLFFFAGNGPADERSVGIWLSGTPFRHRPPAASASYRRARFDDGRPRPDDDIARQDTLNFVQKNWTAYGPVDVYRSINATALIHPALARAIFTGKQESVKPVAGSAARLVSFSIW